MSDAGRLGGELASTEWTISAELGIPCCVAIGTCAGAPIEVR